MTGSGAGAAFSWDPAQYRRFERARLQPAKDLLARIPNGMPRRIADLGCGTGNVTALLRGRWPGASIVGVDSSDEMLAHARREHPGLQVAWRLGSIADWSAESEYDLVFSNAALHWLGDHDALFPRLFAAVAPGGCFAVQMPRNFDAPSHTALYETAREEPWRAALENLLKPPPVHEPAFYLDCLAPLASQVEIWETIYHHWLEGPDPVLEWTRGTVLKPFLDALSPTQRKAFEAAYVQRLRKAYPRREDGMTPFPFRRIFILASKA